jgi:hypothetical protein
MTNRVKSILTDKDWEASLIDGRLVLKFGEETLEFKRRTTSLRFLEDIENLLRPAVFQLAGEEGDDSDYSQFMDNLNTPSTTP